MKEAMVLSSIFVIFLAILTSKKKAFDHIAVLIATLFGMDIILLRGVRWFGVMVSFLLIALYATYFGSDKKGEEEKDRQRSADNVISNGIVAFVAALLNLPFLFTGSLAAALSDTISSEIGVLSRSDPVLITNLGKRVPKGTNGAITPLGIFAGLLGALVFAILCFFFMNEVITFHHILAIFTGGFLGDVLDSFLGIWENEGVLSNGSVNFLASLAGGYVAMLLAHI